MGVHRTFRRFVRRVPAAFVALALAGAARAQVPSFEIPAQDAAPALAAFSQQSQLQLVFDYDAEGRIVGIELLDARAQLSPDLLGEAA